MGATGERYRAALLRRYRRFAYRALGPRADRAFESRVCWMFGTPRSGSSWLLGMLREHQSVFAIDEPLIGHNLGPFLADAPGFDPDQLAFDSYTLRRFNRDKIDEFFADRYRSVWEPKLGELLRERLRAQVLDRCESDPAKAVTVIKEPNGSQSADLLMGAMPDARLLALYRDPRDAIDSELAANRPGSWVERVFPGAVGLREDERTEYARLAAHKWSMRVAATEAAYESHAGPKLRVQYEVLRAEPESTLGQILAWLGLQVTPGQLQRWVGLRAFEQLDPSKRGDAQFARSAEPGGWRTSLTADELAVIDAGTIEMRRRIGYPD